MTGAASLNAYKAWLKLLKKWQDLRPSQSAIERNTPIVCDAMNLENVLRQIKADCCNLHGVAPLKQFLTTAVWRITTPMVQEPSTPSVQRPLAPQFTWSFGRLLLLSDVNRPYMRPEHQNPYPNTMSIYQATLGRPAGDASP
jgi:hypothetical protein